MMVAKEESRKKQIDVGKRIALDSIKSDFFESSEYLTWSLYVKDIDPARTCVEFSETKAHIRFRTSDAKFLKLHNTDDSDTQFECDVELSDKVNAKSCAYKVNKSTMEIRLHKSNQAKKWNSPFKRPVGETVAAAAASSEKSVQLLADRQLPAASTASSGESSNESGSSSSSSSSSTTSSRRSPSPPASPTEPQPSTFASNDKSCSSTCSSSSSSPSSMKSGGGLTQPPLKHHLHPTSSKFDFENEIPSIATSQSTKSSLPAPQTAPTPTQQQQQQQEASAPSKVLSPFYGHTGLVNLGNTCYMNAALQCLINTTDLRDYFLETNKLFQKEINTNNTLGLNGKMAVVFALFLKQMWTSASSSLAPTKLRELLCTKYPHFKGYEQQDTQEFLCSLLSVLHEDLNRVAKKPFYESPLECEEDSSENTFQIAKASWDRFLTREDSVIVDNFYGQFKSKLTCPECGKISITFEPFNSLLVPLPKPKKPVDCIVMFCLKRQKQPIRIKLCVNESDKVQDLIDQVLARFKMLKPESLRVFVIDMFVVNKEDRDEISLNGFTFANKCLNSGNLGPSQPLPGLSPRQLFLINEIENASGGVDEPVLELHVEQICKYPVNNFGYDCQKCSYCQKVAETDLDGTKIVELRRCTRCYRSAYCNSECQKLDWPRHNRSVCANASPLDMIGMPFVFTTTQSELLAENGEAQFRKTLSCLSSHAIEFAKESELFQNLASKFTIELAEPVASGGQQPGLRSHPINFQEIVELFEQETKRVQTGASSARKTTEVKVKILMKWNNQIKEQDAYYPTMCTNMNKITTLFDSDFLSSHGGAAGTSSSSSYGESFDSKLNTNLDDCLKLFTKPEKLTSDNPWYCSKCKKHQEATKQMHVWRLPKYLIVTLKRFQATKASDSLGAHGDDDPTSRFMMMNSRFSYLLQNRVVYNKLNTLIQFPIRGLDMSKYVNDPKSKQKPHVYDLYGVINHIGHSLYSGHYTSFARTHSGKDSTQDELGWRLFDDSQVYKIKNEDAVLTRDAYVLFYRLRTDGQGAAAGVFPPDETETVFTATGSTFDAEAKPKSSFMTTMIPEVPAEDEPIDEDEMDRMEPSEDLFRDHAHRLIPESRNRTISNEANADDDEYLEYYDTKSSSESEELQDDDDDDFDRKSHASDNGDADRSDSKSSDDDDDDYAPPSTNYTNLNEMD